MSRYKRLSRINNPEHSIDFLKRFSDMEIVDFETIYSKVLKDIAILPESSEIKTVLSQAYWDEAMGKNLRNIYLNSPSFFIAVGKDFLLYQKFFCLILLINAINSNSRLLGIEVLGNWAIVRRNPNIPYMISGPLENTTYEIDFKTLYHDIIIPSAGSQILGYQELVTLQSVEADVREIGDSIKNSLNVYNKTPNLLRAYNLEIDAWKYCVIKGNKLVLKELPIGDVCLTEINQESASTSDSIISRLLINKIKKLFQEYDRIRVKSCLISKSFYSLVVPSSSYLIFEGIRCGERTNLPEEELKFQGLFNDLGDNYEFKTITDYTTYVKQYVAISEISIRFLNFENLDHLREFKVERIYNNSFNAQLLKFYNRDGIITSQILCDTSKRAGKPSNWEFEVVQLLRTENDDEEVTFDVRYDQDFFVEYYDILNNFKYCTNLFNFITTTEQDKGFCRFILQFDSDYLELHKELDYGIISFKDIDLKSLVNKNKVKKKLVIDGADVVISSFLDDRYLNILIFIGVELKNEFGVTIKAIRKNFIKIMINLVNFNVIVGYSKLLVKFNEYKAVIDDYYLLKSSLKFIEFMKGLVSDEEFKIIIEKEDNDLLEDYIVIDYLTFSSGFNHLILTQNEEVYRLDFLTSMNVDNRVNIYSKNTISYPAFDTVINGDKSNLFKSYCYLSAEPLTPDTLRQGMSMFVSNNEEIVTDFNDTIHIDTTDENILCLIDGIAYKDEELIIDPVELIENGESIEIYYSGTKIIYSTETVTKPNFTIITIEPFYLMRTIDELRLYTHWEYLKYMDDPSGFDEQYLISSYGDYFVSSTPIIMNLKTTIKIGIFEVGNPVCLLYLDNLYILHLSIYNYHKFSGSKHLTKKMMKYSNNPLISSPKPLAPSFLTLNPHDNLSLNIKECQTVNRLIEASGIVVKIDFDNLLSGRYLLNSIPCFIEKYSKNHYSLIMDSGELPSGNDVLTLKNNDNYFNIVLEFS
jgi:hypothetical protein